MALIYSFWIFVGLNFALSSYINATGSTNIRLLAARQLTARIYLLILGIVGFVSIINLTFVPGLWAYVVAF